MVISGGRLCWIRPPHLLDIPLVSITLTGVPDEAASERFRLWNARLGGVISDTVLPNMPLGAQLVPIKEAVKILKVSTSATELL